MGTRFNVGMYGWPSVRPYILATSAPQAKFFEVAVAGGYQDVCATGKFFSFISNLESTQPSPLLRLGVRSLRSHIFFSEEGAVKLNDVSDVR